MHNETSERPDNARILMDVALHFGSTLELPGLLRLVLERVVTMLEAERAVFALFDDRGRIEQAVTHNLTWTPGGPSPISRRILDEVLRNNARLHLDDAAVNPEFSASESIRLNNLNFVLAVPVVARMRVAGVLYVDSRAPRFVDINNHLQTLEALAKLVGTAVENAQLFEAQRFRSLLLGQLAHNLRTPLMVVIANGNSLGRDSAPGSEARGMAEDIETSAQKMERMIESTLRLATIEAGAGGANPTALDVVAVLRASADSLALLARRYNVKMEVRAPGDLPKAWTVDDRVEVVLDNLLINALKYSESGGTITLSAVTRSDSGPPEALARPDDMAVQLFRNATQLVADPTAGFLEVSVHNEGPAIPTELLARLFRAYAYGDAVRRGLRSTGLGLAIVDQCVRSLGGSVWVDSTPGRGTRFAFTLPTRLRAD